jgi:uncharacterized membrane protein
VVMTIVILISQRRAEMLADRREQLMLQLAFLGDRKQAKVIALLEELRRDDPFIRNRTDREAAAMTESPSPTDVLDAIAQMRKEIVALNAAREKRGLEEDTDKESS